MDSERSTTCVKLSPAIPRAIGYGNFCAMFFQTDLEVEFNQPASDDDTRKKKEKKEKKSWKKGADGRS